MAIVSQPTIGWPGLVEAIEEEKQTLVDEATAEVGSALSSGLSLRCRRANTT